MSDASIVPTPSKVHKASVKWFPEQDNWYKVVIMQFNAMYVNSIRIRRYKASMYSSAKACRFVKFGLTQKGGTMGQKKSKSHNPLKCKHYCNI